MQLKTCSKCGAEKDVTQFYKKTAAKSGLFSRCKDCCRKPSKPKIKLSEEERKKSRLLSQQKYRDRNKDRINQERREAYKIDPIRRTEWSRLNTDKVRAYKQKWKERNKDNYITGDLARRTRMKNALPKFVTEFDRFLINEIYDLARQRTKLLGIKFEVDHIVPIMSDIVCGLHSPDNLQIIPAKINHKKSNKFWPDMP